ncbi:MAG TPA: hypothetical protein VK360_06160 [Acidimicrobiales bacterium]|nr:hypothetical protein [Acidimicrobiales bacterium]
MTFQVHTPSAIRVATEIRSVAARHGQIAGELSELARHRHRIDGGHQARLVVERLQRELDETDARSQQLIVTGDEIEARRREFLVLEWTRS